MGSLPMKSEHCGVQFSAITSCSDPSLEPEEALRLIDLELAEHFKSVAVLTRLRGRITNFCLPVSRLPAEVLARIFTTYQDAVMKERHARPMAWISITHVCQHWREIAVNYPLLWTHIDFRYPRWAEEMLLRSKPSDLVVHIDSEAQVFTSHGQDIEAFKVVQIFFQQHLTRAVEIVLTGIDDIDLFQAMVICLPVTPVPRLRVLTLGGWGSPPLDADYIDTIELMEARLTNTVSLTTLEVDDAMEWDSKLLTGLIHLSVTNSLDEEFERRPSQLSFTKALGRLDTLQRLGLSYALPRPSDEQRTSNDDVNVALPNLQKVKLTDTVSLVLDFLRQVSIPATTPIDLCCAILSPTQDPFLEVVSKAAAHIRRFASHPSTEQRPPKIRAAEVELNPEFFDLRVWTTYKVHGRSEIRHCDIPGSHPHFMRLNFDSEPVPLHDDVAIKIVEEVWRSFPFQNLKALHIDSQESNYLRRLSSSTFTEIFETLVRLSSLYVTGPIIESIIPALTPELDHKAEDPSLTQRMHVLPSLHFLQVINITFDDVFTIRSFKLFLRGRARIGHGLKVLHLIDGRVRTEEDPLTLKRYVKSFSWKERDYSGVSDDIDLLPA
ncbi:hypothetical protein CPB84DRAFT_1771055 [Gymnopilus junonius]|uniref:F-box domain-containing protein n=1 Tax=Gymnopilus junonius TaxID=109634 RepID=A0A9P5NQP6_GYMJU|nr:hypothetical protein CPB84DRAFT_1771055 [Gymnopilus junonius]